jgi:hypothetical protein
LQRALTRRPRWLNRRLGDCGDDLIRNMADRPHRGDIMYANDIRAVEDCGCDGSSRREFGLARVFLCEKRFPRRTYKDRQ